MARLNEPSAPAESIDALKRRFIRQNREIARVNSTQSLRIRTLESEISCLLSENIALREHIIRLQYEIDRSPGRTVLDNMGGIKGKLEAKLTEIGSLVQELGKIQTDIEARRSPKRRPIFNSPKRSPDQKPWKNVLSLAEVTGGIDGKLPPIVEDKYFPRKTLDADELLGMFPDEANIIDSPELGPPPIAHFEDGDPTKFSPTRDNAQSEKYHISEADIQPGIFANLETRKRRRETSNLRQTISLNADSPGIEPSINMEQPTLTRQPLKSGAKRKLDVAEDEDRGETEKVCENDGFAFDKTRPDPGNSLRPGPLKGIKTGIQKSCQESGAESSHVSVKDVSAPFGKTRKALGPKNVNTDPTSPSKVKKLAVNGKVGDLKDRVPKRFIDGKRIKERTRDAVLDLPKEPDRPQPLSTNLEPVKILPETPAIASADMSIPGASEPSAPRQGSEDTLPPSDLNPESSSMEAVDAVGRATRRPRGSVSYAEPNLRAKMRRPTKGLADAVGTDEIPPHVIVISDVEIPHENETPLEKGGLRTVVIKKEKMEDPTNPWQIPSLTEDQSPIEQSRIGGSSLAHTTDAPLADGLIDTGLRERMPSEEQQERIASGAGSTIAALSVGRPKPRKRDGGEGKREVAESRTDVFDLAASSPADKPEEETNEVVGTGSKNQTEGVSDTIRSHRRYSSMQGGEGKTSGEGRAAAMAKRKDRKRESLMIPATNEALPGTELRSARSVARLQAGGGGAEGGTGRAERAASRRRSMML